DAAQVPAKEVPLEQLQRVKLYKSAVLDGLLEKLWGKIAPATAGEKLSRIQHVATILKRGKGEPAGGRLLFEQQCAPCHTLFGHGNKIGPDLTGADRKNTEFLLTHIVDPSAVIRLEYAAYNVVTTDGRSLTGLVAESTPQTVTLWMPRPSARS